MILKPDTNRSFVDPFMSHNTLVIFCDMLIQFQRKITKETQDQLLNKQKNT